MARDKRETMSGEERTAFERLKRILLKHDKSSDLSEYMPDIDRALANKDVMLSLALEHKTPLYCLDEERLLSQAKAIKTIFSSEIDKKAHGHKVRLLYAFKSNDLPYLISRLKVAGVDADVASSFELRLALKLGFERIIYTAPAKTDEDLIGALRNSRRVILNADNADELVRLENLAKRYKPNPKLQVSLRIAPKDSAGDWSKFGLIEEEFVRAVELIRRSDTLILAGVHCHSSWNEEPSCQKENIKRMALLLRKAMTIKEISALRFIDIGGGFVPHGSGRLLAATDRGKALSLAGIERPAPLNWEVKESSMMPLNEFASHIAEALEKELFMPFGLDDIEVWLEPGRFISMPSTSILLKVLRVEQGRLYVDGGINLIGGDNNTFEYFPVVNISRPCKELQKSVIYGCLCDPDDVFGYSYFGHEARVGDVLAVLNQGAYTFSTAWRWQQPTAAYASYGEGKKRLVKSRERFEDRYSGCRF